MAKAAADTQIDPDKAVIGVLALLAAEREDRLNEAKEPRNTELVLFDAGLGAPEIAALLRKKPDAVRKTIQRGRG